MIRPVIKTRRKRYMKRKVISAVLAATMAVTMMMGCGSTGTSADGNGSTSKSEESGNDGGR